MNYRWARGNKRDVSSVLAHAMIVNLATKNAKVNYTPIPSDGKLVLPSTWWASPECRAKRTFLGPEAPAIEEGGWVEHLHHPQHHPSAGVHH